MVKFFFGWLALFVLALFMWFMFIYFGILYNKDLADLQKFTGPVTSIYFEQSAGKSPHYNLCFDFDDYKKLGMIVTKSPYSGPDTLYNQMRASKSLTVYYQPVLFNSTSKTVNIFQIQSNQRVLYPIDTARHECLIFIIIGGSGAILITLLFIAQCYKFRHWNRSVTA